jgi:hypothetical protein
MVGAAAAAAWMVTTAAAKGIGGPARHTTAIVTRAVERTTGERRSVAWATAGRARRRAGAASRGGGGIGIGIGIDMTIVDHAGTTAIKVR